MNNTAKETTPKEIMILKTASVGWSETLLCNCGKCEFCLPRMKTSHPVAEKIVKTVVRMDKDVT